MTGRHLRTTVAAPAALLLVVLLGPLAGCGRGGDGTNGQARTNGQGGAESHAAHAGNGEAPANDGAAATRWLCPMHPTYTSDHQSSCPICGMDLVEAAGFAAAQGSAAGGLPGLAALDLDDRAARLAGVRTQAASMQPLRRVIRAVGTVGVDEARLHSVQTRMRGWIETQAVHAVGERVSAGAPLLAIYSPELVATQEELLRALALANGAADAETRAGAAALAEAGRRRLRLLGVGDDFIATLESTGEVSRAVPLRAPAGGAVTRLEAHPGMEVEPGLELLQLADLSAVWVDARFYEYEAQHVAPGATVTVRPAHEPGLSLSGTIDYVYPVLDEATRTLRARIVLDNGFGNLRPGMYADVLLEVDLGEGLAIPDDAILDTGRRQVVFVAEGGGRFVPREVAVGDRSEGLARIVDGIEPGDQVVVKAAFLLDSESRIRAALLPAPGTPAEGGHAGGHVDGTPR